VQIVINLAQDRIPHWAPGGGNEPVDFHSPMLVAGVHSEYMVIDTSSLQEMIGIQFRPGGSIPFFGVPTDELSDRHVPLEIFWGQEAGEMREWLLAAPTPEAEFKVLESHLTARSRGHLKRHPAVGCALHEFHSVPHTRTIAEVTRQIGLSPRRFSEIFKRETGVTPKVYCRIRRFHEALIRIGQGREVKWAEVALACGYFDQAHFIHEFRAFSGINPSRYLAGRGEWVNHVALND
jgi:AraC-like DNA-binding protein